MLEWTLSKCACCRGLEPVSQWRGPRSLMTPVYSWSRWQRLLLCSKTQNAILKKSIKMNSDITPWKKAIKLLNQFQIFSSVIAIWCCGYCTVSFVIVRIQWKRTEGSGSSLSPMITRYRRWTLSCAPLACSWTLSEQSESKWYEQVEVE